MITYIYNLRDGRELRVYPDDANSDYIKFKINNGWDGEVISFELNKRTARTLFNDLFGTIDQNAL